MIESSSGQMNSVAPRVCRLGDPHRYIFQNRLINELKDNLTYHSLCICDKFSAVCKSMVLFYLKQRRQQTIIKVLERQQSSY